MLKLLKYVTVFILALNIFAPKVGAVQYEVSSGKRVFSTAPAETYKIFIKTLSDLKYPINSTDSKTYMTSFTAVDRVFYAAISPHSSGESLLQLTPADPTRYFPLNVYRKIFFLIDNKILNPKAKGSTFIFVDH